MNLAANWPFAVAALLLLAGGILILLVLLLRRSARAASAGDRPEPLPLDPDPEPEPDEEPSAGLATIFRRASKLLSKSADDRYDVPLYLLAGAERSRPADLLGSAGLDLPHGDPIEAGVSLGHGRGFWFFDRSVVLDVAGPHVLRADGAQADTAGWNAIVRQLQKLRPKRPLDGLLLTIPCDDLLESVRSDVARGELAARMGRIYRKLAELQLTLGFRLPAYVVVTGCDSLTGFTALAESLPESARREMLGWSNPAIVDAAYRGESVNDAVNALGRRLEDLQMEVFAHEPKRGGELLQLPAAVRELAGPLRIALDQLFRASAYQSSLMLRGIYLCGREADEPRRQIAPRTAFLADVLDRKVFVENGLAMPSSRIVTSRNRAVRIAQFATLAIALFFASGLGWTYHRLRKANRSLYPVLQQTYDDMRRLRTAESGGVPDADLRPAAVKLLSNMSAVTVNHYDSIFLPASWFSTFEDRLESSIGVAFEELILRAMRRRIEEKGFGIISQASTRILPARAVMNADGSMHEARAADTIAIDQIGEFQQLRRYLGELRQLEKNGAIYNNLARHGGTVEDLGIVVKYAFDQQLPDSFFKRSKLYETALHRAKHDPFRPEKMRPAAQATALQLVNATYEELFARNAFAGRLQQFSLALQTLVADPPPKGEIDRFQEIARQMRDLEASLGQPAIEWAFRRGFDLGPDFNASLAEMERSPFLGAEFANGVRESGSANWNGFRRLLTYPAPVIGALVATDQGAPLMQLSPDAVLLKSGLDTFLGQGFVTSAAQGRRLATNEMPDRRLAWDPVLLEQSIAVARAHDRFRENTLRLFPADLRASIDAAARERASARMWDLLCAAQQFQPVPPMNEEELRAEIAAFSASQQPLSDVLDGFSRLGYNQPRQDVAHAMTSEAARLLEIVDGLLASEQPYRPRHGSFAWWDGATPLSPAAWDARDAAELAGYLDTTRARVSTLAKTYAQPLLSWVTRSGMRDRADVRPLATKWESIATDLREFDAKKPGNAVTTLEDYIATPLAKMRPADCASAALPAGFRGGRGFFATTLQDLARDAQSRCYSLSGKDASHRWTELAQFFNQRLAGRYPFADSVPLKDAAEADPADVRGFFRIYDATQASIRAMPKDGGFAAAQKFVEDMAAVRSFFAPFLDAPKPGSEPSLDVEATFRILREREIEADQIIGWSLTVGETTVTNRDKTKKLRWTTGAPVKLALRWASDAPRMPFLRTPRRGAAVRERTIVYEYANRWSLLTALNDHRPRAEQLPAYADLDPVTLGFTVDTRLAAADAKDTKPSQSQVFLRLALLAPGTTQLVDVPRFPTRAPRVEETIE